jgi:hypothetical protein
MEDDMPLNEQLMNFFFDKGTEIEELKENYEEYKKFIDETQYSRIEELAEILKRETRDNKWQVNRKYCVLIYDSRKGIFMDSSYEMTRENICGEFSIFLYCPKLSDWSKYENVILNDFPRKKVIKEENSGRILLEKIKNKDEDKTIIKKLIYYYDYYKKLVKN